jgi:hypothetical protein
MAVIDLIQDFRDERNRPTIRTIAEALQKLRNRGHDLETGTCEIQAPSEGGQPTYFAGLAFTAAGGEKYILAFPMVRGCWVKTTLGTTQYLTFDRLHGAHVDAEGNVRLPDDSWIHAVKFDFLPIQLDWSEVDEAIIFLTVQFCREPLCVRWRFGAPFIDYRALHILRIRNVKVLRRYIDERIVKLPRKAGEPPFEPVSLEKIHRALDLAGIQKVRGRKPKMAA